MLLGLALAISMAGAEVKRVGPVAKFTVSLVYCGTWISTVALSLSIMSATMSATFLIRFASELDFNGSHLYLLHDQTSPLQVLAFLSIAR